jgi:hypothetical protein
MIDRTARDRAADVVARFLAGEITNRQLETLWPESSELGLLAVESYIWTLYDDLKVQRLQAKFSQDPHTVRLVTNCIRFLQSDEEYAWPHFATLRVTYYPQWAVVASFGLFALANRRAAKREKRYWDDMNAAGDVSAWPCTAAVGS